MSLPPYLLGPNPWATMMAQHQFAAAHAQAQAAAAQAHAHALQQQMPPPSVKPDVVTDDKLQEKGKSSTYLVIKIMNCYLCSFFSSKMDAFTSKEVFRQKKVRFH